jgi:hypothetical protein
LFSPRNSSHAGQTVEVREKWLIALEMQIINGSSAIFPKRNLMGGFFEDVARWEIQLWEDT